MCERVADIKKTLLISDSKKLGEKIKSPRYRRDAFLESETGEGIHEVIMDERIVTDKKPIHAGIAILQHSKLMLLKFVDFLHHYLIEGSFVLVYAGNLFNYVS